MEMVAMAAWAPMVVLVALAIAPTPMGSRVAMVVVAEMVAMVRSVAWAARAAMAAMAEPLMGRSVALTELLE